MEFALQQPIWHPGHWAGPIYTKELRVASRRKRHYVLRVLYLLLLSILLVILWSHIRLTSPSYADRALQLAEAGKRITLTLLSFQFVTTQVLIVILLSTAISDEISHQTLGVLMTTPLTSLQIVTGKLLSKVTQLILLLGMSLPVLSLLRMFGGMPWATLGQGFAVTFTATLLAGSLSLWFSIRSRRAHEVVARTLFVLATIYVFIPVIGWALRVWLSPNGVFSTMMLSIFYKIYLVTNPWALMSRLTIFSLTPGQMPGPNATVLLLSHCLVMTTVSVGLWLLSAMGVRRAALRQINGQTKMRKRGWLGRHDEQAVVSEATELRPVKGSAVVWKELRQPLLKGGRNITLIGMILCLGLQLFLYIDYGRQGLLDQDFTHITCGLVFLTVALFGALQISATPLTYEKERRSWPILLTVPLEDSQILWGKAVGSWRRCLPMWWFLVSHVVLFTGLGWIHPVALVLMALVVVEMMIFISGVGLYVGSLVRKTGSAMVGNTFTAAALWLVLPALVGLNSLFTRQVKALDWVTLANPWVQTSIILGDTAGLDNARQAWHELRFRLLGGRVYPVGPFIRILGLYAAGYMGAGLWLLWRAKTRLRKHVFG